MPYFQRVLGAIGWLFLAVGLLGTAGGLVLLLDRDATIEFNGTLTSAVLPKLVLVGMFAVVGCAGGLVVRGTFGPIIRRLTRHRGD